MLWERSPLAKGEQTAERYLEAGHIVVQTDEVHSALEDGFMHKHGIERKVEVTTYNFMSSAQLLPGTNRMATMHRRLAQEAARCLPVELRDAPVPVPAMEQSMQWHKHRT
ncbi:hypothetical protein [Paraburkholderia sp. JHI869]|uniref:hypothetical protein n=1 Tax=Paraburkholderia sp. JHI869 TaxID=3112959 RepID=UPI00316E217F